MKSYLEACKGNECKKCNREEQLCYEEGQCLKSKDVIAIVHFVGGSYIRFEFEDEDECRMVLIAPYSNATQWLKVQNYYINKSTITFIEVE